jgi:hypothetical protein
MGLGVWDVVSSLPYPAGMSNISSGYRGSAELLRGRYGPGDPS